MGYTNPQKVRDLLGVDIDAATDTILNSYIGYADKILIKNITETIVDEDLEQIGETYNVFQTEYPFIADITPTSATIPPGIQDVSAYYWDADHNKNTLTVTSINGLTGQVIVEGTESFLSTIDVRIDYNRYICKPDWTLIELASSYYAAFMWVGRELYLVPERYFLGELRIYGKEPWKHFKIQFDRLVQIIVNQPISKVDYERMVMNPREVAPVTQEDLWWFKKTGQGIDG